MPDEEFIDNLPDDPLLALKQISETCHQLRADIPNQQNDIYAARLIRFMALATTIISKHSLIFGFHPPGLGSNVEENIAGILDYFNKLVAAAVQIDPRNLYKTSLAIYERELDVGFHYEFSDGEIERIQALINELREDITKAGYFDEEHRQRLLKRLEKVQAELHKKVSDLDVILGAIVEIGATGGRFGEDAKPLVDRMREIGEIVAGVFRRAENLLPGSEFPMLPKPDNADKDTEE